MSKHQEERSPFKFFALVFVYSWGWWIPIILLGLHKQGLTVYTPMALIGGFAPLAAALTLVVRRHGWREGWTFIRQAFDFRTKPLFYLLALAVPMAVAAVAHYLAPVFGLQVADVLFPEGVNPWLMLVPYFFFTLLVGGGQEEFGWRGYAQQPLQERYGIIKASMLIGVVWGVWHLPLWVFPDAQGAYSAVAFIIHTTAVSLVYGFLYNASGKKLIIPLFFHAMWNAAPPLFPFLHEIEGQPETAYWVYAGVTVVAGIIAGVLIQRKTAIPAVVQQ